MSEKKSKHKRESPLKITPIEESELKFYRVESAVAHSQNNYFAIDDKVSYDHKKHIISLYLSIFYAESRDILTKDDQIKSKHTITITRSLCEGSMLPKEPLLFSFGFIHSRAIPFR
jgi:hypothetical protein